MKIDERVNKRFKELDDQMRGLPSSRSERGVSLSYDTVAWQQWATSAMGLIRSVFGEDSPHYKNIEEAYKNCAGYSDQVDILKGIFKAAKADFDGGYLFTVQASISGEIFGDFIGLAKSALRENYKDVAAVLACAALEDALKRFAEAKGLIFSDKVLQEVVNALKAKGLVTGAQKSLLDSMPKIRDYAMHANWEKITAQDVGSVIGFVEQFLLSHFSDG